MNAWRNLNEVPGSRFKVDECAKNSELRWGGKASTFAVWALESFGIEIEIGIDIDCNTDFDTDAMFL